jgi:hypothetical protein
MKQFRLVRPWSADEDKMLIKLLTETEFSMQSIGLKLKRSKGAIKVRAAYHGLGSTAARKKAGLLAKTKG